MLTFQMKSWITDLGLPFSPQELAILPVSDHQALIDGLIEWCQAYGVASTREVQLPERRPLGVPEGLYEPNPRITLMGSQEQEERVLAALASTIRFALEATKNNSPEFVGFSVDYAVSLLNTFA